jgi:hypothetical protein
VKLQQRLTELSARRRDAQQKLVQYRQLQKLLEPFQKPQETVQPNLVTKDGQLGKELDRMRLLLARVSGRVESLPADMAPGGDSDHSMEIPTEDEKVMNIINMT